MGKRDGTTAPSPWAATALSGLLEGVGQAYNRQPIKAMVFLISGLTLSTTSGLNTWLVQNILGLRETRIGPERISPRLAGLWLATYLFNLVDAWRTAARANRQP